MLPWIVAAGAGIALAVLLYRWREAGDLGALAPVMLLRALALVLVLALLLDAPAGRRRAPPPLVALDASASWTRAAATSLWEQARARARALARDSLLLIGDSVRTAEPSDLPQDDASRVQGVVERALGAGRPLVLITDGEVDDPAQARTLPAGSRVEVIERPAAIDAALLSLDAPRSLVSGDSAEVRLTIGAADVPVTGGTLALLVDGRVVITRAIDSLAARAERTESIRLPLGGSVGSSVLSAALSVAGDVEPRNDTLSAGLEIVRAAGAVLVSSSPDFDSRHLMPVLRGAVSLPTRGYFRVAPGQWRQDESLSPVAESEVRRAVREAPVAILHGDTAIFGPPRAATTGALALVAPPAPSGDEWYAVSAPVSPIAPALSGIPWDSLPPLDVGALSAGQGWEGIVAARGRQFERRPVVVGTASGRRVIVVGASGLWRWAFRGGSSADAYAALWGSIFDWLIAERLDARGAIPASAAFRAGDRIRWRRGAGADSVVGVVLTRRVASPATDSVTLRFGSGASIVESDPLPAGIYDVRVPGGTTVLVVNASRELLPRPRTLEAGLVGEGAAVGEQPRLRQRGWPYLLAVLALCGEWLLRRRRGMR